MTKRFNLVMGAVHRQEAPFLREWICYHLALGVQFFYLLDNHPEGEEEDHLATQRVLSPFIKAGVVVNERFQEQDHLQREGYTYLIDKLRPRAKWLALLDVDEFLLPRDVDSIPEVLESHDRPEVGALAVHWAVFGTSFHKDTRPCQIEAYTRRARYAFKVHSTVKVIVNTDRVHSAQGHLAACAQGFRTVDTLSNNILSHHEPHNWAHLRINHYVTRSEGDWARKRARGWKKSRRDDFWWSEATWDKRWLTLNRNEVLDTEIHRFLPALRKKLLEFGETR